MAELAVRCKLRSMTIRAHEICLLAFMAANAWAQTPQQPSGSVTGYVYCADTNAPARFARVMVEPAEDLNDSNDKRRTSISGDGFAETTLVRTRLDGSYSVENVAPGRYYVLAEMPGYLSPLAEFDPEEIGLPDVEVKKRLRAALQSIQSWMARRRDWIFAWRREEL